MQSKDRFILTDDESSKSIKSFTIFETQKKKREINSTNKKIGFGFSSEERTDFENLNSLENSPKSSFLRFNLLQQDSFSKSRSQMDHLSMDLTNLHNRISSAIKQRSSYFFSQSKQNKKLTNCHEGPLKSFELDEESYTADYQKRCISFDQQGNFYLGNDDSIFLFDNQINLFSDLIIKSLENSIIYNVKAFDSNGLIFSDESGEISIAYSDEANIPKILRRIRTSSSQHSIAKEIVLVDSEFLSSILICSRGCEIEFHDISQKRSLTGILSQHTSDITVLANGGYILASGGEDLKINIWDIRKGEKPMRIISNLKYAPNSLDLSRYGENLFISETFIGKKGFGVFNTETGMEMNQIWTKARVSKIELSSDGKELFVGFFGYGQPGIIVYGISGNIVEYLYTLEDFSIGYFKTEYENYQEDIELSGKVVDMILSPEKQNQKLACIENYNIPGKEINELKVWEIN